MCIVQSLRINQSLRAFAADDLLTVLTIELRFIILLKHHMHMITMPLRNEALKNAYQMTDKQTAAISQLYFI